MTPPPDKTISFDCPKCLKVGITFSARRQKDGKYLCYNCRIGYEDRKTAWEENVAVTP